MWPLILIHISYLISLFQLSTPSIINYYITNSTSNVQNRSCFINNEQLNDCMTLEMLVEELSFHREDSSGTNISIVFVNEFYSVHKSLQLSFSGMSTIELKPLDNIDYATFNCINDFSTTYSEIEEIAIEWLNFYNCGRYKSVISFKKRIHSIAMVTFSHCSFSQSTVSFVRVLGEIMKFHVINCLFNGSTKTYAIYISSKSFVDFRNSNFSNNPTGSVIFDNVINITSKFIDCFFLHNTSPTSEGNSIEVKNSQINLNLERCAFWKGSNRPAILINKDLFQPPLIGNLTIINSTFQEHTGQLGALWIQNDYSIFIFRSIFNFTSGIVSGGIVSTSPINSYVHIEESLFMNNYANNGGTVHVRNGKLSIIRCSFTSNKANRNGGALYVRSTNTNIQNSTFLNNTGYTGGAVTAVASNIYIINSIFNNNKALYGGAIYVQFRFSIMEPCNKIYKQIKENSDSFGFKNFHGHCSYFVLTDNNFINNSANNTGGAIHVTELDFFNFFLGQEEKFTIFLFVLHLSNTSFVTNTADTRGGALSVLNVKSMVSFLQNCSFINNKVSDKIRGIGGALAIEQVNEFHVNSSKFISNIARSGGAMLLHNLKATILGCTFEKNEANHGGAIYSSVAGISLSDLILMKNRAYLKGGGIFALASKLAIYGTLTFAHNQVISEGQKGLAIFVNDRQDECKVNSCSIYLNNSKVKFVSSSSDKIPLIFGGMIGTCFNFQQISSIYNKIIVNSEQYFPKSQTITSTAFRFCLCKNSYINCKDRELNETVVPGQTFNISATCVDHMYQPVSCDVTSTYNRSDHEVLLGRGQSFRSIIGCEKLIFNAYAGKKSSSTVIITGEIFCGDPTWKMLKIHINVEPCPLGFQLTGDKCSCDNRLKKTFVDIECNINAQLIIIERPGWLSYAGGFLRVHKKCPLNYCDPNRKSVSTGNPDTQCRSNRSGVLCGRCASNYSVVLGSWNCKQCSHLSRYNFIWLTIFIALAGVVLVAFLLLLKITVSSGTINGLLLYANLVSSSGLLDHPSCTLYPILRVFLSWINLDLGIEVCFYSGMDVYQKSWLQFLFPLYIYFLVGLIIFICHYSSTVMKLMGLRNIEVLATLFLISYSKLLKSIAASLHYTDILIGGAGNLSHNLTSQKVWLYDGNILFFSKQHLPMFTVSLIFLVFLFLPYTLLLLFEQCLKSLPRKRGLAFIQKPLFTSIIDPYHAPYTKHHRYWTGLGLLIRCCLFTIFATSDNVEMNMILIIAATALLLIIMVTSSIKIYRKKSVNLLELFYYINLLVLALLVAYGVRVCVAITFSASLSLLMFVLIVLYHIHVTMLNNINCYKELIKGGKEALLINRSKLMTTKIDKDIKENTNSTSTTYFELRESLITN